MPGIGVVNVILWLIKDRYDIYLNICVLVFFSLKFCPKSNKMDLLPYVNFDLDKCKDYARRMKPDIEILTLSTVNGQGLNAWYEWLKKKKAHASCE